MACRGQLHRVSAPTQDIEIRFRLVEACGCGICLYLVPFLPTHLLQAGIFLVSSMGQVVKKFRAGQQRHPQYLECCRKQCTVHHAECEHPSARPCAVCLAHDGGYRRERRTMRYFPQPPSPFPSRTTLAGGGAYQVRDGGGAVQPQRDTDTWGCVDFLPF